MNDFELHIVDRSGEIRREMGRIVPRILEEIGLHLEGEAKLELENNPRRVDTGLLRNSITHARSGNPAAISHYASNMTHSRTGQAVTPLRTGQYSGTMPEEAHGEAVYIGTNVEYAVYVHEGTREMAPNRFLRNAVQKNESQIKRKIKEALQGH